MCVDSLDAFKEFFSDIESVPQTSKVIPEGRDEVDEEELQRQKSNSSLEDDWDNALFTVLDDYEKVQTKQNFVKRLSSDGGTDVLDAVTNKGQENSDKPMLSPGLIQLATEKTPENQIIRGPASSSTSPKIILSGVRKRLNFSETKPQSFKLASVHKHFIGCEPGNQHSAEDDCLSVLRCVCQIGLHFAEWADQNAVSLNLFKK